MSVQLTTHFQDENACSMFDRLANKENPTTSGKPTATKVPFGSRTAFGNLTNIKGDSPANGAASNIKRKALKDISNSISKAAAQTIKSDVFGKKSLFAAPKATQWKGNGQDRVERKMGKTWREQEADRSRAEEQQLQSIVNLAKRAVTSSARFYVAHDSDSDVEEVLPVVQIPPLASHTKGSTLHGMQADDELDNFLQLPPDASFLLPDLKVPEDL